MESCVSVSLKEKVKVRFSHRTYFEVFPGQVYFMMVLYTCRTLASMHIDGTKNSFATMNLKYYSGENVPVLATAALKCIKVMNTGYVMDIKIGSSLLKKVDSTSTSYFNRNIHNEFSRVKRMDLKYSLKDPKLLKADPEYSALGPVILC